eukprot:7383524-Prymnesium_polylepis.2
MSMIWFRALRDYQYAMRVDTDVCLTQLPPTALFTALTVDYAFGLETDERHRETVETFGTWMRGFMAKTGLQPTVPPVRADRIYFTNFFVSRVAWWTTPGVDRFLSA